MLTTGIKSRILKFPNANGKKRGGCYPHYNHRCLPQLIKRLKMYFELKTSDQIAKEIKEVTECAQFTLKLIQAQLKISP